MITRRRFLKVAAAGGALTTLGNLSEAEAMVSPILPDSHYITESSRKIPLIAETDVVVAGGGSRAVAAAARAAKAGCKVFLIAYMPYLGDDICGSFLYERAGGEAHQSTLSRKVFPGEGFPVPLHVKTALEDELISNGVDFLYSSYVTNVLADESGRIGGVVIANRSGRQAIRCKAVIDATHQGSVARLAGCKVKGDTDGKCEFQYTVVGNVPKENNDTVQVEILPEPFDFKGKQYPVTRYTFRYAFNSDSYASLMKAEQFIRSQTWDAGQVDSADLLWYIPTSTIACEQTYTGSPDTIRKFPEQAFKAKGIDNLWILGPCADVSREVARSTMRPLPAMCLGELLGECIAGKIKTVALPRQAVVRQSNAEGMNLGQVKEILKPLRPALSDGYVDSSAGALPVLGRYDVVVLGGGTAGASAGISAARQGAKTLILEYLHGLGGLGTLGLIGRYWDGFREGYSATIDEGVHMMAPPNHPRQLKDWKEESLSDWKMEWLRRELLRANGQVWFGVLGCGALVSDGKVKGVVVATPWGRGVVLSEVLIDSTGSADIAIAAGASFDYTDKQTPAVQGAGMGKRDPGDFYVNNDWLFIDDTDILDVSRVFVQAKHKFKGHYDLVKIPQTRERRRVVGEHVVSVYDVLNHRRYPDTISYHKSSFDTHGTIVDPYFILSPPLERHMVYDADVPLRSLLPRGLDGILTTGLGASAHRDAMPVIRMQPCLQNQGYAVGYLSAMAVREKKPIRKVDIRKVQRHLVEIGNLPGRVLTDKEFKGFGNREMKEAALSVTNQYKGLEVLLTDHSQCIPLLHEQMAKVVSPADKVAYASILCILGDARYAPVLEEEIRRHKEWDKGWHYTGMHQFGRSISPLDALIIALGNAKVASTLPVIMEKARLLEPEDYFSHFRAVCMAAEAINSCEAIDTLAGLLTTPGVRYHAIDSYQTACNQVVPDEIDVSIRNKALKELHLARALYLCGDKDGLGEQVLKHYATSLQGHYARYAECSTITLPPVINFR
jgi:NADPH-dependent 2,4-dienoyl-CoA reductase/sulfur reductase-like enzyme